MKTIMLTVVQFALLVKVREEVGFNSDKINEFIDKNQDKENIPELELDENEFDDLVESLEVFDGEEEDNNAIEAWLTELKAEPTTEETPVAEEEPTAEEEKQE